MAEAVATFDSWGIVEVMGHKKYAGHIIEQVVGATSFIRVDVPEARSGEVVRAEFSKLIGAGSVYMITPTTEEVARRAADALSHYVEVLPVHLPVERQIAAGASADDAEIVDEDDGYDEEEGG